jgi:hypothetical protein
MLLINHKLLFNHHNHQLQSLIHMNKLKINKHFGDGLIFQVIVIYYYKQSDMYWDICIFNIYCINYIQTIIRLVLWCSSRFSSFAIISNFVKINKEYVDITSNNSKLFKTIN